MLFERRRSRGFARPGNPREERRDAPVDLDRVVLCDVGYPMVEVGIEEPLHRRRDVGGCLLFHAARSEAGENLAAIDAVEPLANERVGEDHAHGLVGGPCLALPDVGENRVA